MHNVMSMSPEGREFQRVLNSSAQQIVEEWFDSEQVRVTFTRWCTEMMIDPRAIGTATLLYFTGRVHKPTYAPPFPMGGSQKFVEALMACCKDHGADLFTNAFVDGLTVQGGEAKSVRTKDGEEYIATNAVISTINIKDIYQMLGDDAPKEEARYVQRLKQADFAALNQSFALKKIPEFKAGPEVLDAYCIEFAPEEKEYLETFSNYKLGGFNCRWSPSPRSGIPRAAPKAIAWSTCTATRRTASGATRRTGRRTATSSSKRYGSSSRIRPRTSPTTTSWASGASPRSSTSSGTRP